MASEHDVISLLKEIAAFGLVTNYASYQAYKSKIKPRRDLIDEMGAQAIPDLLSCFLEPDRTVRSLAADILSIIGDSSLIPKLKDKLFLEQKRGTASLELGKQKRLLTSVKTAITRLEDAPEIQPALDTLAKGDEQERLGVLEKLTKHEAGFRHVVHTALNDPSDEVRKTAINSLGKFRNTETLLLDYYLRLLEDPAPVLRASVVTALGASRMNDRRAVFALLDALTDKDFLVRKEAMKALTGLNHTSEAVPLLIDLLPQASPEETDLIIATLRQYMVGWKQTPERYQSIIDAVMRYETRMENPSRYLPYACELLCNIPDPAVIPAVIRVVNHDDPLDLTDGTSVGVKALRQIRTLRDHMGYDRIANLLVPYIKDPDSRTRISAIAIFGVLGGDTAYIKLRPFLESENNMDVREFLNFMIKLVQPPNPLEKEHYPKTQSAISALNIKVAEVTRPSTIKWSKVISESQTYTLQLVSLICNQQQEPDGDEIYIRFEHRIIWSSERLRMAMVATPEREKEMNQYNFEKCEIHGIEGWKKDRVYRPDMFKFTNMKQAVIFQLWESDGIFRGGDDLIGQVTISPLDGYKDVIRTEIEGAGARYTLSYRLILD